MQSLKLYSFGTKLSLCMGISDDIEIATIAQVHKATIIKIKVTIALPFQSSLTSQR